ncbi:MAG: hypothetical protein KGZ83_21565 [Sulfuricella sp.]|nr:hypothetical protein [Sulfuricella sp.]
MLDINVEGTSLDKECMEVDVNGWRNWSSPEGVIAELRENITELEGVNEGLVSAMSDIEMEMQYVRHLIDIGESSISAVEAFDYDGACEEGAEDDAL